MERAYVDSFHLMCYSIAVYALVGNSPFRRSWFACSVVVYYFIVYHPYPVAVVRYAVCA